MNEKMIYLRLSACKECPYLDQYEVKCKKTMLFIVDYDKIDEACPLPDSINFDKLGDKSNVCGNYDGSKQCCGHCSSS